MWNRSPVQVRYMRQGAQGCALGWPWGMWWGGRLERGSGWGTHVHSWLIHVNVWQKPLQYCKVISLQLKKKKQFCFKTATQKACRSFFPAGNFRFTSPTAMWVNKPMSLSHTHTPLLPFCFSGEPWLIQSPRYSLPALFFWYNTLFYFFRCKHLPTCPALVNFHHIYMFRPCLPVLFAYFNPVRSIYLIDFVAEMLCRENSSPSPVREIKHFNATQLAKSYQDALNPEQS